MLFCVSRTKFFFDVSYKVGIRKIGATAKFWSDTLFVCTTEAIHVNIAFCLLSDSIQV